MATVSVCCLQLLAVGHPGGQGLKGRAQALNIPVWARAGDIREALERELTPGEHSRCPGLAVHVAVAPSRGPDSLTIMRGHGITTSP